MKKHVKKTDFSMLLKIAGWLLANLALGLFLWCILAYCAFQLQCIKDLQDVAVISAFIFTAPLGIPLGVFLLHVVFYKPTKLDWKIMLQMFLLGVAMTVAGPLMKSVIIIICSPIFIIINAIISCICMMPLKRVPRFGVRHKYSWKSER